MTISGSSTPRSGASSSASTPERPTGRFFAPSSSTSSPDKSPFESPRTPSPQVPPKVVKKALGTPPPVRALSSLAVSTTPDRSLDAREKSIMSRGIARLEKLDTPERTKHASVVLENLFRRITPIKDDPSTPEFHRGVVRGCEESPWALPCVSRLCFLSKASPVFDLDHIVEGDGSTGKHLILPGSPLKDRVRIVHIDPSTQVYCGYIGDKFSTFFPEFFDTEEKLLKMLREVEIVASSGGRQLCRHPEFSFFIERYARDGGFIRSAFPIFFYAEYREGACYHICDGVDLTSEEFFRYGALSPVVFSLPERGLQIKDIGPALEHLTHIPCGIYGAFSKFC